MAYDRGLAYRLSDRLMAEANRELSDLIAAQKLRLSCEKYDHVHDHPLPVAALDISSRLRGPFTDKNVMDRMAYDCEFWACVNVEGSRYGSIRLVVPCFLDTYILHVLDGAGGALFIEPSAPDDFSKLLRALRTQLQTGEAVKARVPSPPQATPQPSGCFAMIAGTLVRRAFASLC